MVNFIGNIQDQFFLAYEGITEVGATVQQQVTYQLHEGKEAVAHTYRSFVQGCQDEINEVTFICQVTANKVEGFLFRNKETLFFIGCCAVTAHFSPHLFFTAAIVTVILRVEFTRNLKKLADYYLQDERNPYVIQPYYNKCVNALDMTLASVAAVDAVALGTIYLTNSWLVFLLPALGGIAAGNCLAKWGMNVSDFLVPASGSEG
jgi:hypothetical protein